MTEEEYQEQIVGALQALVGGQLSGPSGIEGLAMALAGSGFVQNDSSVAGALYAIASALDRIADHMENTTP